MPDMFAHKLCAMGERLSPRDIYDVWFFLQNHTEILKTESLIFSNLSIKRRVVPVLFANFVSVVSRIISYLCNGCKFYDGKKVRT